MLGFKPYYKNPETGEVLSGHLLLKNYVNSELSKLGYKPHTQLFREMQKIILEKFEIKISEDE